MNFEAKRLELETALKLAREERDVAAAAVLEPKAE
ncbi:hypothetical protein EDF69_002483 [Sphingomonas sp. JUb134]|nr:hypothetical protein [Sphingomonas sp. JUb134]